MIRNWNENYIEENIAGEEEDDESELEESKHEEEKVVEPIMSIDLADEDWQ